MDKNTIIGFVLIALIFLGFMQLTKRSDKEIAAEKRYNDSIALVQQNKTDVAGKIANGAISKDSLALNDSTTKGDDAFGDFSIAAKGEEKFYTIENELVKITLSNKGARVYSVQLKKYSKRDSLNNAHPLILFNDKESNMSFTFVTNNNRVINSSNLYFEPVSGITKDSQGNQTLILRLKTSGQAYMDFAYTLPANNYMLSFGLKANGMNTVMPAGTNSLDMAWSSKVRQQEKGRKFEDRYSAIHYKYVADDVEGLSESKNDEKKLTNKVKWIAFKDQFFSSILIANDALNSTSLKSTLEAENSGYLKSYNADMSVAFDPTGKVPTTFRWFFGPNQYKVLSAYDKETKASDDLSLNKLIPLGWGIFGWVNRFAIIPMFNLFSGFMTNFGLIILLMTVAIKLVLFPLT